MRIAFTNWSNRLVGGAEQYLATVSSHLAAVGHEVSLWHETSDPEDRAPIRFAENTPTWDARRLGLGVSLEALRQWKPEVIFCQGMLRPSMEALTQTIAPSIFFAHNYHGLCINGGRTLHRPVVQVCPHRFGAKCLFRYYPQRCGGLNPFKLLEDYQTNAKRLETLAGYSAVISHSDWITAEYKRHGIACRQVRFFANSEPAAAIPEARGATSAWRFLMMGRMAGNKGGDVLLDAMPLIAEKLDRPVSLLFAGDGPSRPTWEKRAAEVRKATGIEIGFAGWLSGTERTRALETADVLMLPSLWPEPYGMIGLEAGQYGVPAVAFAVGGIPDWLKEGVNGCLASGDRPSAAGFANAVVRCLADAARYRTMRKQARETALQMTIDRHYEDLKEVFDEVRNHKAANG